MHVCMHVCIHTFSKSSNHLCVSKAGDPNLPLNTLLPLLSKSGLGATQARRRECQISLKDFQEVPWQNKELFNFTMISFTRNYVN